MKLRALLVIPVLALVPVVAGAQSSTPPGSLTVLSRPAGASFKLSGDRTVVGRTPFTIQRGLLGRFVLETNEAGYERWRREVLLDGVTADTLWISLRPKQALKAGVRSLIVPGWGQFYSARTAPGWAFLVCGLVSGSVLIYYQIRYMDRVEQYDAAVTYDDRKYRYDRAEAAYEDRQIALGVTAGIWAVNVIDAVALFPDFATGRMTARLEPRIGTNGEAGVAVLAEVRF